MQLPLSKFHFSSKFYQITISVFALYLLILSSLKLAQYTKSTTDENLFRDTPSLLYVTKGISLSDSGLVNTETDSIKVSDLLLSINGNNISNLDEWLDILDNFPPNTTATVKIFRTLEDKTYTCDIIPDKLPLKFLEQVPECVYVQNLTPGGVSDLAGMKKGDLIFRINEQEFSNSFEADFIMRSLQSGTTILYDIIRKNERIVLPVTLAKFGITLAVVVLYLAGLIYWGFGAFIAIYRANLISARLLGLSLICFGYVIMSSQMFQNPNFSALDTLLFATFTVTLFFGLAFWNHSKLHFPEPRTNILSNKKWVAIHYALASFYSIFFIYSLWSGNFGFTQQLIILSSFILIFSYSFLLHFIFRKQRTKEYQRIRSALNWISFSTVILALFFWIIILNSSYPNQLGFIGLILLIIPSGYFYIIGKYRLLELNLKVSRSIQYTIIKTSWIIFLTVLFIKVIVLLPLIYLEIPNLQFTGTSFVILDVPPDQETHDFWEKLIIISISLTFTLIFLKTVRAGNNTIEKRFNRGKYNLSRATSELAEIMATKLGMEELAKGVVERLAKLMQLKRVGIIFFRDEKVCCHQEAFGFDGDEWDEVCLTYGGQLIDEIKRFRSESRFSIDYLQSDIKEDFLRHGFKHIFPIRFKDRLVGSFVIGEKLSETPLHLEDLTFLGSVAKQTSIAIENAFLHEELTEQERLKHELKIARRIQMASLPQKTPSISGLDIAGSSTPALEVGGDYFDYLNSKPNGITIIVGDVSGKGTSAALYMSKVQGIIRSLHAFNLNPKDLFTRANELLRQDMERKSFVTAIGCYFDTDKKKLHLARAGHLPLFYFCAKKKEVLELTPKGLGLGLEKSEAFGDNLEEISFSYKPGDVFLFVTDGITEAQTSSGEEFGEERLVRFLSRNNALSSSEIQSGILNEVQNFVVNGLPHDDQTIVVVKAV